MPDRWIRERALADAMIEPFVESQRRDGCISYGLSSTPRSIQDPFNGCPSCATAGAVDARQTRAKVMMQVNARTCVPFLGLAADTAADVGYIGQPSNIGLIASGG